MCGAMVSELALIGQTSLYFDVWGNGVRVRVDWGGVDVLCCGVMASELGLIGQTSLYFDVWGYGARVKADWGGVDVL